MTAIRELDCRQCDETCARTNYAGKTWPAGVRKAHHVTRIFFWCSQTKNKLKKVDANQGEIVDGLRRVGAAVKSIASIGKGFPDLLVGYRGIWYVAELKDGKKPPSQRQLTPAEKAWHQSCIGKAPVHVWNSLTDALETIGASR